VPGLVWGSGTRGEGIRVQQGVRYRFDKKKHSFKITAGRNEKQNWKYKSKKEH
jgi:hypothetical protein